MVYMEDSDRAAAIARERRMHVGLHLNVTQPFTDDRAPVGVRDRQARLVERFGRTRAWRWLYDPRIQADVERCVCDQLERFESAYGGRPTHVDGHNHAHLSLNVLHVLRPGTKLRAAHSPPLARTSPLDPLRWLRQAALRRRFVCTEYFFALRTIHPRLGGSGLERALSLAREHSVELMVHPARDDEHRLLLSADWAGVLAEQTLSSYAELR
jgi:predicted glycoside hydrolase/deacetylase ChbG (UPF0249 family)